MTVLLTRFSATQRDILTAMALGAIVLRRPGMGATLHCPETGRTITKLGKSPIARLISRGYLEGSTQTKRGRLSGIMRLTPEGRDVAGAFLEGIGDE